MPKDFSLLPVELQTHILVLVVGMLFDDRELQSLPGAVWPLASISKILQARRWDFDRSRLWQQAALRFLLPMKPLLANWPPDFERFDGAEVTLRRIVQKLHAVRNGTNQLQHRNQLLVERNNCWSFSNWRSNFELSVQSTQTQTCGAITWTCKSEPNLGNHTLESVEDRVAQMGYVQRLGRSSRLFRLKTRCDRAGSRYDPSCGARPPRGAEGEILELRCNGMLVRLLSRFLSFSAMGDQQCEREFVWGWGVLKDEVLVPRAVFFPTPGPSAQL
jgi:hypothetical protein